MDPMSLNDTDFFQWQLSLSNSTPSPPYSVSLAEATFYYSGLYGSPKLVYRTGPTPWSMPTGPEAYSVSKELRPVFGHKLNDVWKDLGPKVCQLLDSHAVLWTSIDVVRFLKIARGEVVGPVVLWIGVAPETLLGEVAHASANGCLDLLKEFGIDDVEVEFRESIYTRSAGPNLLKPVSDSAPDVDVRGPLTPALGLPIAAQATPHVEGTGGIYLAEGGCSKKVLLVTARHVLFPPNDGPNVGYAHTNNSAPRRNVLLLGTKAFDNLVDSIKYKIRGQGFLVDFYERQIETLPGDPHHDEDEIQEELKHTHRLLPKAREAIKALEKFHEEVEKEWLRPRHRVLGHIARSPPITTEGFTEDYAVVELDSSKFKNAFKGNVIDLGAFWSILRQGRLTLVTVIFQGRRFLSSTS